MMPELGHHPPCPSRAGARLLETALHRQQNGKRQRDRCDRGPHISGLLEQLLAACDPLLHRRLSVIVDWASKLKKRRTDLSSPERRACASPRSAASRAPSNLAPAQQ